MQLPPVAAPKLTLGYTHPAAEAILAGQNPQKKEEAVIKEIEAILGFVMPMCSRLGDSVTAP